MKVIVGVFLCLPPLNSGVRSAVTAVLTMSDTLFSAALLLVVSGFLGWAFAKWICHLDTQLDRLFAGQTTPAQREQGQLRQQQQAEQQLQLQQHAAAQQLQLMQLRHDLLLHLQQQQAAQQQQHAEQQLQLQQLRHDLLQQLQQVRNDLLLQQQPSPPQQRRWL